MFVKVERDTWVNMLRVSAVTKEADRMWLQLDDGLSFMVEEAYEPDVKRAMRAIETIMLRFKCGHF